MDSVPDRSLESFAYERHAARLILVLYVGGERSQGLFDGETYLFDSFTRLGRFDFWVREPGHLALALLDALKYKSARLSAQRDAVRGILDDLLRTANAEIHRVALPGTAYKPWGISGEMNLILSNLASRAVISDRPSFTKGGSHQIVLEARGIALAQQILAQAPSFAWYHQQCQTVRDFWHILDSYDLAAMPYLGMSPVAAASTPLISVIQQRYDEQF